MGAGVFFVCLVILIVIGIRKFVLTKQDEERRKARKEKRERRKAKQKSAISTQPSSENKGRSRSRSRSKSRNRSKGKEKKAGVSPTKQVEQTEKYIRDEIEGPCNNLGYPGSKVRV